MPNNGHLHRVLFCQQARPLTTLSGGGTIQFRANRKAFPSNQGLDQMVVCVHLSGGRKEMRLCTCAIYFFAYLNIWRSWQIQQWNGTLFFWFHNIWHWHDRGRTEGSFRPTRRIWNKIRMDWFFCSESRFERFNSIWRQVERTYNTGVFRILFNFIW